MFMCMAMSQSFLCTLIMSAIVNKAYLEYRDRWIEDEIEKDGGRERRTKIKEETDEKDKKRDSGERGRARWELKKMRRTKDEEGERKKEKKKKEKKERNKKSNECEENRQKETEA